MKTINDESRLILKVRFQDSAWASQFPSPLHYRIDCLTTQTTVLDWTDIDPTTVDATGTVQVTVTSEQNAIINVGNPLERKELTIEANYGTTNQFVDTYDWQVRNITGVN